MKELDDILSGGGEAMPDAPHETAVTETRSDAEGETQTSQDQASATGEQTEAQAEAERERRRGSGGQIDAANERHRHELERVRKEERAEARRMFAAETARQREAAVQEYIQKQQNPPPPVEDEIFNNPTGAINRVVSSRFEQADQKALFNDRLIAEGKYGDEAVAEAEAAFISALEDGRINPNSPDYHSVVASPNRYAASVKWHKEYKRAQLVSDPRVSTVLEKFGTDPSLIEKFEAFIAAPQSIEQQPALQQQRPTVMPSNLAGARNVGARSGPAWSGPSPIEDIFSRARPSG